MTPYRPRRAGSARYSAYFKVQVWVLALAKASRRPPVTQPSRLWFSPSQDGAKNHNSDLVIVSDINSLNRYDQPAPAFMTCLKAGTSTGAAS